MTDIPGELVTKAARAYGWPNPSRQHIQRITNTLEAVWPEIVAAERERIAQAIEAEADSEEARLMRDDAGLIGNWIGGIRQGIAIARRGSNDTGVTLTPESGSDRNVVRPSTTPDDGDTQ